MNSVRKVNEASYRVLRTLLYLFEKDLSMKELVDVMVQNVDPTFNNFVASKYINTCKSCGIDIQKVNGKYALINIPFSGKFPDIMNELLFEIKQVSETLKPEKTTQIVSNLFEKLHITYFKSEFGLKSSINKRIIKTFEKALAVDSQIDVIYENGEIVRCKPLELSTKDKKIIFKIKKENDSIDILPDDVIDIEVYDKNAKKVKLEQNVVIYELKGRLAKRYQLRENEQIIKYKANGSIVISNKYEDRTELLHRLMRYDSLCKVLKPTECAEEIKSMINASLSNYGL
ncbi:MAG: hypothetical protein K6E29_00555 [Cyanobacteria bacterium RUI128]|nr:hypothetical protein [Cyanobacteria bacterium RUI128]